MKEKIHNSLFFLCKFSQDMEREEKNDAKSLEATDKVLNVSRAQLKNKKIKKDRRLLLSTVSLLLLLFPYCKTLT